MFILNDGNLILVNKCLFVYVVIKLERLEIGRREKASAGNKFHGLDVLEIKTGKFVCLSRLIIERRGFLELLCWIMKTSSSNINEQNTCRGDNARLLKTRV